MKVTIPIPSIAKDLFDNYPNKNEESSEGIYTEYTDDLNKEAKEEHLKDKPTLKQFLEELK